MKFRNKKKFQYGTPAYTSPFPAVVKEFQILKIILFLSEI
jgi:hypothetical protein